MRSFCRAAFAAAIVVLSLPAVAQESYPKAPITFINASSAGGASDIFMRALSEELQKVFKQPAIIENRPGGAFNIAGRACAEAKPDGYTFCVLPGEAVIYNPHLFKSLPYNPETSFEPILTLFMLPQILAVRSDLKIATVDDLAKLSKDKPRTLSYASPGIAQVAFVESFINKGKGGDLVKVPFRGGGDVINGMMTGTTPVAFIGAANLLGLLESKTVVGLAVDTKQRLQLLPGIPTVEEIGFKGDMTVAFFGLFAPAKTPAAVTQRMRDEVIRIITSPDFLKRNIVERGLALASEPDTEIKQLLASGRRAAAGIVREAGITPQ